MLLQIADVLDPATIARLRGLLSQAPWSDGRATAGAGAAGVKANEQAVAQDPRVAAAAAEVLAALRTHPLVTTAALPLRFSTPVFSRTGPGGGYGLHSDNALMAGLRGDLAWTLFLTDTAEGGALVIEDAGGERAVAPVAGMLLLYPASFLHRVAPVTAGLRLVAFGWIQSRVRDAARRALLFDLLRASQSPPDAPLLIQHARANLLRMWAD